MKSLTYGQKAVGLSNTPSDYTSSVVTCQEIVAYIIDMMNDLKTQAELPEIKRLCSEAATQFECAQMWAEKAIKAVEALKPSNN